MSVGLVLVLLVGLFGCFLHVGSAMALPPGFEEETFVEVPAPTAFDFTPNGRMLVASKPGQLYVVDGGQRSVALDLGPRVCSNSERGLLGVAVDPDFGTAGHDYVYLYYTFNKSNSCLTDDPSEPVNRVSRFTMSGTR
jgi:glucose/arabinose dehydrogenase